MASRTLYRGGSAEAEGKWMSVVLGLTLCQLMVVLVGPNSVLLDTASAPWSAGGGKES